MGKDTESTTKFKADISQLKAAMQEAGRAVKAANAEFKAATAGMENWSKSASGLSAKLDQLDKVWKAQNTQLKSLEQQYKLVVEREGETSVGAQELLIKINNQKAAIAKTVSEGEKYAQAWKDIANEQKAAKTPMGQLNSEITKQEYELNDLKNKYKNVVLAQGENSKEAKALAKEITSLSNDLNDNKQKMADADAAAEKLTGGLDEVGEAAEEAGEDTAEAANGGFTVLKGVMANLATQGIDALLNGFKKMGSALIDLGKDAVNSFSQMEQLEGGIRTLFDSDYSSIEEFAEATKIPLDQAGEYWEQYQKRADTVIENANKAYKTAGLSANEYMETVTSFSASLNASLGENAWQSANYADMAIQDMSDNANKMGTNMQSIQNAYQGFAKQNYTMLDNLKLGYGGTKTEMERLLRDAEKIEGYKVGSLDVSNFADVVEAIHIIQEDLGIYGATADEAASTVEGSCKTMKSAWANLVTGIGSGSTNLDELIDNFISSLMTYIDNLAPVIQRTISGISNLISAFATDLLPKILDKITAEIPGLISSITTLISQLISELLPQLLAIISSELPEFLKIGAELLVSIIQGIVQAIPELTSAILEAITMVIDVISASIPDIVDAVVTAIPLFMDAIIGALPQILEAVQTLFSTLLEELPKFIPALVEAQVEWWKAIADAIPKVIPFIQKELPVLIDTIVNLINENLPILLDAAVDFFMAMVDAIPLLIDALVPAIPKIVDSISKILVKNLPKIIKAAITLFNGIIKAIPTIVNQLAKAIPEIINSVVTLLVDNLPTILDAAVQMLMAIVDAIPVIVDALVPQIPMIIDKVVEILILNLPVILDAAIQFFMAIIEAIPYIVKALAPQIPKIINTITDTLIKNIPIIIGAAFTMFMAIVKAIPAFLVELGKALWSIVTEITKALIDPVIHLFEGLWNLIMDIFSPITEFFGTIFGDAWENIKKAFDGALEFFSTVWNTVTGVFAEVPRWFYRIFAQAFGKVKQVFEPVLTVFSAIWGTIKKAFDGVVAFFKGIFGTAAEEIKKIWGGVVDFFEWVYDKIAWIFGGGISDKIEKWKSDIDTTPTTGHLPQMATGGVLKKGQIGILEGSGAEAVVPLDQNQKWISAVAKQMKESIGGSSAVLGSSEYVGKTIIFNQTNNSPKALDALEVYRETNSLLFSAGVRLNNV